jgi:hypothetical protein
MPHCYSSLIWKKNKKNQKKELKRSQKHTFIFCVLEVMMEQFANGMCMRQNKSKLCNLHPLLNKVSQRQRKMILALRMMMHSKIVRLRKKTLDV